MDTRAAIHKKQRKGCDTKLFTFFQASSTFPFSGTLTVKGKFFPALYMIPFSEERIYYLLKAYTDRTATAAEEAELFRWAATISDSKLLHAYIEHLMQTQADERFPDVDWEGLYYKIWQQAKEKPHPVQRRMKGRWMAAAAVTALLIAAGFYLFTNQKQPAPASRMATAAQFKNDIKPGSAKAILKAGNVQVMLNQHDTSFSLAGNRINISSGNLQTADAKPVQYTLTTPMGGDYHLTLSDGTKVWLNAGSRLEYPSVFNGNEREVALEGEAYFVVKTDAGHPFIVNTARQSIKVLGTEFNVNAYTDEQNIITTLVAGKVEVNSSGKTMELEPGEQAQLSGNGVLNMNPDADVEQAVAWKNGYFRFDKADIHTIMQQLARWYDIKVNYAGDLPNQYFGAIISRNNNISGILNMLSATGDVHFRIEGREVFVIP